MGIGSDLSKIAFGSWDASAGVAPTATDSMTLDTRGNFFHVLDALDTASTSIEFRGVLSPSFKGGSVNFRVQWAATTATSGDTNLTLEVQRLQVDVTDLDGLSYDTLQEFGGDITTNGTSGVLTESNVVLATTDCDDWSAGDAFTLRLSRRPLNAQDSLVGDIEIMALFMSEE